MAEHQPNTRLRKARLDRGWSQAFLASQLNEAVRTWGSGVGAANSRLIRRWEAGHTTPSPLYRRALLSVFEPLNLIELGVLPDANPNASIGGMVLHAPPTRRDALLMGLGAAGLGVAASITGRLMLPDTPATTAPPNTPDASAVGTYVAQVDALGIYYWTLPADTIFESACAHAKLGVDLLRSARSGLERAAISAGAARAALHAGRAAFFDLNYPAAAGRCYAQALALVEQGDDPLLTATIWGHVAFIPGFSGQPGQLAEAVEALGIATAHARSGSGPLTRSWLHAVRSEIEARCGNNSAALGHLRQAEDALAGTSGQDPEWFDWYDEARLDGFRGYVEVLVGHHVSAVDSLTRALHGLTERDNRQKAVLHFDLAAAAAPIAPDQSVEHAARAVEVLEHDAYATALARVALVRSALAGTTHASALDERLRHLLFT